MVSIVEAIKEYVIWTEAAIPKVHSTRWPESSKLLVRNMKLLVIHLRLIGSRDLYVCKTSTLRLIYLWEELKLKLELENICRSLKIVNQMDKLLWNMMWTRPKKSLRIKLVGL